MATMLIWREGVKPCTWDSGCSTPSNLSLLFMPANDANLGYSLRQLVDEKD